MTTNIHIYPSPYVAETRIFKETRSLLKLGLVSKVILVGIHENNLAEKEELWPDIEVHRLKLRFKNSSIKIIRYLSFFEFFFRAYFHVRKMQWQVVNVHSLHVLFIGVLLKRNMSCKLVYDAHELETEVTGSTGILRYISKRLERYCIKYVDELIVVSDSIAEWYRKTYNFTHITAIYNVPHILDLELLEQSSHRGLRANIGVKDNTLLFIYQGVLSRARGVDEIMEAFCCIPYKAHVVFMGSGQLKEMILKAEKKYPNVHYHPPVPSDQVLNYTREADVGIHIIKNTCLNHYYCLPNKVFEYFMSGIPFILSDFPEMAHVVKETGGGWVCRPDKNGLRERISQISNEELHQKRRSISANKHKYGWQIEEQKYISIYKRLITHA